MIKSRRIRLIKKAGLIGSSEELAQVAEQIMSAQRRVTKILITGEDGLGKTDIAKSIFNSAGLTYKYYQATCMKVDQGAAPLLIRDIHKIDIKSRFLVRNAFDTDLKNQLSAIATGDEKRLRETIPGLYYSFLNYIQVPPLRHRPKDIEQLVPHISSFLTLFGYGDPMLSDDDIEALKMLPWYGNVTELKMFMLYVAKNCRDKQMRETKDWISQVKCKFDEEYESNKAGLSFENWAKVI